MARNWALVVGINSYNPLNFTPLKYAKRDAEQISEFFKAAGFEVCCFTDDSPPLTLPSGHTIPTQPTYGNLITFLQDRFETEFLDTGDNCWFFFAGHGERHQDRDYLMPIDANSRGAEVIAGLTINYVQERLSRCGADNVIMILDACRSEGSRDGGGIRAATQKGLITISSCQPTQKSWELDELQQGAFTYALLEALQLPGPQSCATVERLSAYLKQRVPALCQQYGIPENKIPTPRISADPIEKQHFILIPQYARQVDLDLLKLDAFRLRRNNPILAEQICIRLNALAMGRDLEVLDLLLEIRNEVSSRLVPQDGPVPDEASPRSPNTAATITVSDQLEESNVAQETSSSEVTPAVSSQLPSVNRKALSECDTSKLLFIKNVRDPNGDWAYTLDRIRDMGGSVESRVFELYWTSVSRGSKSASKGDLMLLNQQAKITHVVEMLDDEVRKLPEGYFRWVRVVWMPDERDWYQLPHQRDVIGFEPPTIGGGTAYSLANLSKFQASWDRLETFQQYVFQVLAGAKPPICEEIDESLSSERFGANYYAKLQDLLTAKDWEAADDETRIRMLEVMNRQQKERLCYEDIQKFPCLDLRNIDRLWVKSSNGQFGFSVQKKIWENCGSPTTYNRDWEKFGVTVGWRTKGFLGMGSAWKRTGTWGEDAPQGHLPFWSGVGERFVFKMVWGWGEFGLGMSFVVLFSRVKTCRL